MVKSSVETTVAKITRLVIPGQHGIFGTVFLEFHLVLLTRYHHGNIGVVKPSQHRILSLEVGVTKFSG